MGDVAADLDGLDDIGLGRFLETDEEGPGAGAVLEAPGLGGEVGGGLDGVDVGAAVGEELVGIGDGDGAGIVQACPGGGRGGIQGGSEGGDHKADKDENEDRHRFRRGGRGLVVGIGFVHGRRRKGRRVLKSGAVCRGFDGVGGVKSEK